MDFFIQSIEKLLSQNFLHWLLAVGYTTAMKLEKLRASAVKMYLFESLVKELNLKDDDYLFDAIFNSESEEYFEKMIERIKIQYEKIM